MAAAKKNNKGKPNRPPVKPNTPAKNISVNYPSIEKMLEGKSLYVFLAIAVLLVLVIYRDFVSGTNVFMYKDIGSDTMTYWWPHYVQLSEYIRSLGVPKWSFNNGMGQNIYAFGIGDPFSLFLCLLPKDGIPYGIIFMEIIKIIGGGLLFYLYLRMLNVSLLAAVTGGLLYSFSGYMILGSCWYLPATETFYIALILYSTEKFLRHGVWYLLPICFCLLGILQPFYIYLDALLLTVYCIIRGLIGEQTWKDIFIALVKIGGLAVVGVLLGSVVVFSNVHQLIENPRVNGGASLFKSLSATPLFQVTPSYFTTTTIYRLFSNDLIGTGTAFKGPYSNYLEAPAWYIGLVTLLLVPQAFLFFEKRKRNIFLILTAVCMVPLVFIYFRYMFWLFAAPYYRTYTFFFSLLFLFFALKALTSIDKTGIVHIKTLVVTLVVLLFLLYHNFTNDTANEVNKTLRNGIAFLLILYTGLIYMLGNKPNKHYAVAGIGLCMFIELASFSNITVNDRQIMSADDLHQKKGYNDYTVEAVNALNTYDKNFYRVVKDYKSDITIFACLNDPQIQGYHGLTNYAEWNQPNYVRFLEELHVNNAYDSSYSKWLYGLSNRVLLWTMASVKYVLSKDSGGNYTNTGFSKVSRFGNVIVYKNNFFLPFGFSYKKYIPLSEFHKLSQVKMDQMLLNAAVVDDTDLAAFNGMPQMTSKDHLPDTLQYNTYIGYVNDLKKDSLTVTHFDNNHITGTIKPDEKKVLCFTIPFDAGWHAKVDGKPAKLYRIDVGFTGLLLDKGEHNVELYYEVPYLGLGAYISLGMLLLYGFAFVKFRKRRI